jgi:hypothetical protein
MTLIAGAGSGSINQRSGSVPKCHGSATLHKGRVVDPDPDPYWIRIQSGRWIRIRIRIRNPDPDPGGHKRPTKVEKNW